MYIFLTSIGKDNEYMTDELREHIYSLVRRERREKADRIKNQENRDASLAAGILLNAATRIYMEQPVPVIENKLYYYPLNVCADKYDPAYDFELELRVNGKPEFKRNSDRAGKPLPYFNLSHSGKFVVCAVSDKPIGIDIEGGRKVFLKTAKRFFTGAEYQWVCKGYSEPKACEEQETNMHEPQNDEADPKQCERFLRIWTMKEAYSKLSGVGIAHGISQAEFLPDENGKMIMKSAAHEEVRLTEFWCLDYRIAGIEKL